MRLRAFTIGIEVDDAIQIAEKIDIRVLNALPSIPDVVGGVLRVADGGAADVGLWDRAIPMQGSRCRQSLNRCAPTRRRTLEPLSLRRRVDDVIVTIYLDRRLKDAKDLRSRARTFKRIGRDVDAEVLQR